MIVAAGMLVALEGFAMAALTPEEVNQLGGEKLTAVGAEMAGNADGTIPPYTGGYTKFPAGFDRRKDVLPDPFANEKPLYSITSKNMTQYTEKLTEATRALITKYPDFRVDVYPTHRTVVMTKSITENTKKSALTAKLENDGKKLTGAVNGIPFPIPKNGLEAIWNGILHWSAPAEEYTHYQSFVTTGAGRRVLASEGITWIENPYWGASDAANKDVYCRIDHRASAPPNRNGEGLMWIMKTDKTNGDPAWQYLPGQRRVKMAPDVSYDTPNTTIAGAATYDDNFIYGGSPDRYDWKILGKKEIIIPYNSYKLLHHSTPETALGPHFVNPDFVRWELHRVWAIEGNLKPGTRHIYSRRIIYLDEDSWVPVMSDQFDNKNQFYRGQFDAFIFNPDTGAPYSSTYWGHDFVSGVYFFNVFLLGPNLNVTLRPESAWNPQALAGSGIR